MKYYKLLLFIIVIFSCLSLSGCDTIFNKDKFKEGSYNSLNSIGKPISEYTLIYCDIKKVSASDYEKSQENIFIRDGFIKTYYMLNLYIRTSDMKELAKVTFTNIGFYYNESGVLYYKGEATYLHNESIISEEFKIYPDYGDFIYWTESVLEILYYEPRYFEIDELEYVKTHKGAEFFKVEPYTKAKMSLTEIPEGDIFAKIPNQTQCRNVKQWIQVDLDLYNNETEKYEKATLFFKGHRLTDEKFDYLYESGRKIEEEGYFSGNGYIVKEDNTLFEFNFRLYLNYKGGNVKIELFNHHIVEEDFFYAMYEFKRV